MKTIRTNSFETNSSSTHSITISNVDLLEPEFDLLVEDNILYLERLSNYRVKESMRSFYPEGYERAWETVARTKHTKAALLISYLFSLFEGGDKDGEELFKYAIEVIRTTCGYSEIKIPYPFYPIVSYYRWDEIQTSEDFTLEDCVGESYSGKIMLDSNKLIKFINNVILDDKKIIADKSEEY